MEGREMPVRNRRLNEYIKRGREESQSHRHSKPVSRETHAPECLSKSLRIVLEKLVFLMSLSHPEDPIVFIVLCLKDQ